MRLADRGHEELTVCERVESPINLKDVGKAGSW